jgi:hypothetical protein
MERTVGERRGYRDLHAAIVSEASQTRGCNMWGVKEVSDSAFFIAIDRSLGR